MKRKPETGEPGRPTYANVRMHMKRLDSLRRIARERSYKEQKDITVSDLVREAVAEKYGHIPEEQLAA